MSFHLPAPRRRELSFAIGAEQSFRLAAVHRYKYYPSGRSLV